MNKVLKGLLIASAGAALTYLAQEIPNIDFGVYTPVAVAGFSALVNAAKVFLQSQS